jgi:HD-like signal output (HDOD) protein
MPYQSNTELMSWLTSLEELDHTKIVSASLQTLLDELRASELSIERVSQLLAAEPMLCAKILMISNSSFFGFSRQIEKIEEAVVIIGASKLRSLIYTAVLLQNGEKGAIIPYIKHSLTTALFCKAIAEDIKHDSDSAYLVGLLHLLPIIANFKTSIEDKISLPLLREASSILLTEIGLPETLCNTITNLYESETNNNQTRILRVGFSMALILSVGNNLPFKVFNLEQDFEELGISPKAVAKLCDQVELEQDSLFELLG